MKIKMSRELEKHHRETEIGELVNNFLSQYSPDGNFRCNVTENMVSVCKKKFKLFNLWKLLDIHFSNYCKVYMVDVYDKSYFSIMLNFVEEYGVDDAEIIAKWSPKVDTEKKCKQLQIFDNTEKK